MDKDLAFGASGAPWAATACWRGQRPGLSKNTAALEGAADLPVEWLSASTEPRELHTESGSATSVLEAARARFVNWSDGWLPTALTPEATGASGRPGVPVADGVRAEGRLHVRTFVETWTLSVGRVRGPARRNEIHGRLNRWPTQGRLGHAVANTVPPISRVAGRAVAQPVS